jgi:hypothetical protein
LRCRWISIGLKLQPSPDPVLVRLIERSGSLQEYLPILRGRTRLEDHRAGLHLSDLGARLNFSFVAKVSDSIAGKQGCYMHRTGLLRWCIFRLELLSPLASYRRIIVVEIRSKLYGPFNWRKVHLL